MTDDVRLRPSPTRPDCCGARVVPSNSMEARGCLKVGRRVLAHVTSPFGGSYTVFSNETEAHWQEQAETIAALATEEQVGT